MRALNLANPESYICDKPGTAYEDGAGDGEARPSEAKHGGWMGKVERVLMLGKTAKRR